MLTRLGYFLPVYCRYHAPAEERRSWWWTACPCTIFLWTGTKTKCQKKRTKLTTNRLNLRRHQAFASCSHDSSSSRNRESYSSHFSDESEDGIRAKVGHRTMGVWNSGPAKGHASPPKVKAKPSWLDPPQMHVPVPKIAQKASESYARCQVPQRRQFTDFVHPGSTFDPLDWPKTFFFGLWARDSGHILLLPIGSMYAIYMVTWIPSIYPQC